LATKLADAAGVCLAWYLTWLVRFGTSWFPAPKGIPDFGPYASACWLLALGFTVAFHAAGAYRRERIEWGFRAAKKVGQGAVLGTMAFVALCYFRGDVDYSRVFLALFGVLVVPVMVVVRTSLHLGWKSWLRRHVRPVRVLLIGTGPFLEEYRRRLSRRQPYPVEWVGRVGPAAERERASSVPYLGTEAELPAIIAAHRVDQTVLSYNAQQSDLCEAALEILSNELVVVKILPDFGRYATFTYSAHEECSLPLIVLNQPPAGMTARLIKRTIDLTIAGAFFVLGAPLYLGIALLVKLTSRGRVLYSQIRVGADGTVFKCYKFRSMKEGAESETGPVWARAGDDRTTRLGRWLRSTSLDELPQLYNVLKGEMSLVGPRPERPVFVEQFRREIPKYMLRHRMKSGLTGWAQVNGWRGNTSLEERIKHDLYYIGHWSNLFDIKILWLSLFRGFTHENAY